MKLRLGPGFTHDGGHSYYVDMPGLARISDTPDCPAASPLLLLENGKPLLPAHSPHGEIRARGKGRYRHWAGAFWFSASDNTDPNENGRVYEIQADVDLAAPKGPQTQAYADALEAVMGAWNLLAHQRLDWKDVRGKRILELGPGKNLGHALILRAMGADVTLLGPAIRDESLHPAVHRELLRIISNWSAGAWPKESILRSVEAGSLQAAGIRFLEMTAEELGGVKPLPCFDIMVSSAVLEHVRDLPRAVFSLSQCAAPGAVAIHQIDLRDHLDFSRPLEFLLEDDEEYLRTLDRSGTDRGTRARFSEILDIHRFCGFVPLRIAEIKHVRASYLEDFTGRLALLGKSRRFRGCGRKDLSIFAALLHFKKP